MTTRCEKGHYYDGDRFAVCPYCAPDILNSPAGAINQPTVPVDPISGIMEPTIPLGMPVPEPSGATVMPSAAPASSINDERTLPVGMEMTMPVSAPVSIPAPPPPPPPVSIPAPFPPAPSFAPPPTIPAAGFDDGKTVRWTPAGVDGTEPTVGWLIGVSKGDYFGECFDLKNGRNFIGRGSDMDVVLAADQSVSRSRHAIIIYEPHGKVFIAQPGDAKELFYVNNDVVLGNVKLKPYDILMVGETKLMFFPLCGPKFSWEDIEEEDAK